MFKNKQSSSPIIVGNSWLGSNCGQTAPIWFACLVPEKESGFTGFSNLRSLTGGFAYGTPLNEIIDGLSNSPL